MKASLMVLLHYRLAPGLVACVEHEKERNYGAFQSIDQKLGEAVRVNTITF